VFDLVLFYTITDTLEGILVYWIYRLALAYIQIGIYWHIGIIQIRWRAYWYRE